MSLMACACVYVDIELLLKTGHSSLRITAVLTGMFLFALINMFINTFLRVSKLAHITGYSWRRILALLFKEGLSYKYILIVTSSLYHRAPSKPSAAQTEQSEGHCRSHGAKASHLVILGWNHLNKLTFEQCWNPLAIVRTQSLTEP